jgi:hypothetical protein
MVTNVSEEYITSILRVEVHFCFNQEDRGSCSSKTLVTTYKKHGVTTKKTKIDIFAAARTSNLNRNFHAV